MKFLSSITDTLLRQGFDHLHEWTVIFPMHRAGTFMRDYIRQAMTDQQVTTPVFLPRFLTIDELVDSLCPYQPDDDIRTIARLYQMFYRDESEYFLEHTHQPLTLDIFFSWGQLILADFNNIDLSLADAQSLFANSAEAQQLDRLDLPEETLRRLHEELAHLLNANPTHAPEVFQHLWQSLARLYQELHEDMLQTELAYRGARYRYVIDHFDELLPRLQERRYMFVGFNYLLNAERELLIRFRDNTSSTFCFDTASLIQANTGAGRFIRENLQLFPAAPETISTADLPSTPQPIRLIQCVSAEAQAQYVHTWLRENHHSGQRSAIVIADEALLESVIYSLPPEWSSKVNITKGFPLSHTHIYASILDYLAQPSHDKFEGETYADVLTRLLNEVLSSTKPADTEDIDQRPSPELLTWQEALLEESIYQSQLIIRRLRALILDGTLSPIGSLKTLRLILRRMLEGVSLPFHGEPVTEIQIMGVLETRLLDFDNLLILNCEEGVIPSKASDRSFIPFYLRKYYRMQTFEEESLIYAYNFFRLVRRSTNVSLLFQQASEGLTRRSMSRFIMQILTSPDEFQPECFCLNEGEGALPAPIDWYDPNRPSYLATHRDHLSLSPSAIGTFKECKCRFYLTYVLGLRTEDTPGAILSPSEFGILVHSQLQEAYQTMSHSTLPAVITADMIKEYLADPTHFPEPDEHRAEHMVANEYTRRTLQRDALLPYLEVHGLELPLYHDFPITLDDGTTCMVSIGGTIDRLDVIEREGVRYMRVLDYKTGSFHERYNLQLRLYSMICNLHHLTDYPIEAELYFVQSPKADTHRYIFSTDDDFMPSLIEDVKEILTTTEFTQCRPQDCPSYCPFFLICQRKPTTY